MNGPKLKVMVTLLIVCIICLGCSSETINENSMIGKEDVSENIVLLNYDSIKSGETIEYDTEKKFKYLSGTIVMPADSDYLGEIGLEVFDENLELIGYTTKVFAESEKVHFCMDIENVQKIVIKSSDVETDGVVLNISNLRITTGEYGAMNSDNFPEAIIAEDTEEPQYEYQRYESIFEGEERLSKGSTEDYSYVEFENGVQILNWLSDTETIMIPDQIAGKPVLEIADQAFAGNHAKTIILPINLEFIGNKAFVACSMEHIEMQEGLKYIGESAFDGCYRLQEIHFPSSLIYIGKGAFRECSSLEKADLNSGLRMIGEEAFAKCMKLNSEIIIPESITVIPDDLYSHCTQITQVVLHNQVKELGVGCFSGTGIQSIQIPEGVRKLGNDCFAGCEQLTGVSLPDSLHVIGSGAFSGDISLCNITLPDSLREIGESAFTRCSQLKELVIPRSVTDIGDAGGVFPVDTTLNVFKNSYGYSYAQSHNCDFKIIE